jgi:hypothetical protein
VEIFSCLELVSFLETSSRQEKLGTKAGITKPKMPKPIASKNKKNRLAIKTKRF